MKVVVNSRFLSLASSLFPGGNLAGLRGPPRDGKRERENFWGGGGGSDGDFQRSESGGNAELRASIAEILPPNDNILLTFLKVWK